MADWLRGSLELPAVAALSVEEDVDGAMALEMVREDWMGLGASSLKTSKILAEVKKLR